jgi:hypothetical protein
MPDVLSKPICWQRYELDIHTVFAAIVVVLVWFGFLGFLFVCLFWCLRFEVRALHRLDRNSTASAVPQPKSSCFYEVVNVHTWREESRLFPEVTGIVGDRLVFVQLEGGQS